MRQARLADDKDVIEEHSGARRSCASQPCVPLTLCCDAGLEGAKAAKADVMQFGNPLLRDDDEEGDDGKEDGDAARKE